MSHSSAVKRCEGKLRIGGSFYRAMPEIAWNLRKNCWNPLVYIYVRGIIKIELRWNPDKLRGKARKENRMSEPMTDFQLKGFLKMVLEILKGSESIEEARAKVEALLDEGK